jgi:uncharacterized protein (DUF2336 family)
MTHHDNLIFNAAGAFTAMERPGMADAERLDALAMPLYDGTTPVGRRRIAAVLSECRDLIPVRLVAALVCEPLEIAAALLISRAALTESMMATAVALRGESHARIIAMRSGIGAASARRIDALVERIAPMTNVAPLEEAAAGGTPPANPVNADTPRTSPAAKAETARSAMRGMMMARTLSETSPVPDVLGGPIASNLVARLINLALANDTDLLATALADELAAAFPPVRDLVSRNDLAALTLLLKAIDLGPTDCFAIVAAFNPPAFASREAVARFHLRYQAMTESEIGNLRQRLSAASKQTVQRLAG